MSSLVGAVALLGLVTAVYTRWLEIDNPTIVALTLLFIVLVVAAVAPRWVAITTSMLAFLCFNYFFLSPVGTLTIDHATDMVALITLLAVSVVASQLSAQSRRQAEKAMDRSDELAQLLDLTQDILLVTDTEEAVSLLPRSIARRFGFERVAICFRGPDGWTIRTSPTEGWELDSSILESVLGGRTPALLSPDDMVLALRTGGRSPGFLVLRGGHIAGATQEAIAGVATIAIERAHLLKERAEAEILRRNDELKSALFASLSHDLRTPLTAVTMAANNLKAAWLTEEDRREQVEIVLEELARLDRLFQNLVEMARIETSSVKPDPEWIEPIELVEAAIHRVGRALAEHELRVEMPESPCLVHLDPRLTSAALAHVLENAAQYSPPGTTIMVEGVISGGTLSMTIRDEGPGVHPAEGARLFDPFYRGRSAGRHTIGTGMGLAISRGLVEAQGGLIGVENDPRGGARFTITLPTTTRAVAMLEEEDG
jgi:two-component system sensor histidine kinase KdpD